MTYLYNDFNGWELGILSQGFGRKLFTRPQKGSIISTNHSYDNGCTLYFESDYLSLLISEYEAAKFAGKFISSNANSDWLRILSLLKNACPITEQDIKNGTDYYTVCSPIWNLL